MVSSEERVTAKYPIYIISKGRWKNRLTARCLEDLEIPYRIVVEPQEYEPYAAVIEPAKILVLPFSNLGLGSIPARNWVWEHALQEGHARHWILDDNISRLYRLYNSKRLMVKEKGAFPFRVVEDFIDPFENVGLAGLQYSMFASQGAQDKAWTMPMLLNTRIYSCILIDNAIPFRWRGRYNEDTDLSLRVLKAGYCTVLVYAFLINKITTMKMKGGNTDELYKQTPDFDGRLEMAKSLWLQHPDVVKITRKWGRWQHQVDYRPFKGNKLKPKPALAEEAA